VPPCANTGMQSGMRSRVGKCATLQRRARWAFSFKDTLSCERCLMQCPLPQMQCPIPQTFNLQNRQLPHAPQTRSQQQQQRQRSHVERATQTLPAVLRSHGALPSKQAIVYYYHTYCVNTQQPNRARAVLCWSRPCYVPAAPLQCGRRRKQQRRVWGTFAHHMHSRLPCPSKSKGTGERATSVAWSGQSEDKQPQVNPYEGLPRPSTSVVDMKRTCRTDSELSLQSHSAAALEGQAVLCTTHQHTKQTPQTQRHTQEGAQQTVQGTQHIAAFDKHAQHARDARMPHLRATHACCIWSHSQAQ
jgi:hypothetical protein